MLSESRSRVGAGIEKRYEVIAVDEQSFHPCHRRLQRQHHTVQHKYRSRFTHASTPPPEELEESLSTGST